MSNKTPYELRFEILKMAEKTVTEKNNFLNGLLMEQYITNIRDKKITIDETNNLKFFEPSSEEILAKANELYKFVLEK